MSGGGESAILLLMDSESVRSIGGGVSVSPKVVVRERRWFVLEWWEGVRPYALRLSIDLAFSVLLLMSVWGFQQAAKRFFPVDGIAHDIFDYIHQLGAAASFVVFASISVRDIWRISNGKGDGDGQ